MSEKLRRKIEKKLATLQGPEWDSEDEEEEEEGGKPATNSRKRTGNQANGGTGRKAEPGSSVRKKRKSNKTSGTSEEEAGKVVYVGHIPHGFYEEAMKGFFGQFGGLKRCRLSRSKRSAKSKGYAFLEFEDSETAGIVADTMDGYFIYDKQLVCSVIPPGKVHKSMFKGCDKRFKVIDWHAKHREGFNQPRNEHQHIKNLLKSEAKKRRKLAAMGIEYIFTGFKEEIEEMKEKESVNVETEGPQVQVAKQKKKRSQEPLKKMMTRQEERPKKQSKSSKISTSKQGEEYASQQQQQRIKKKKHRKGMPSPTEPPLTRIATRSCSARKKKVPG